MPDRRLLAIFAAGVLGLSSCTPPPQPVTGAAPSSESEPKPAPEPPPAAIPAEKPAEEAKPERSRDVLVVVNPGGEEAWAGSGGVSLAEASRAEKERRSKSGPSSMVINDKNLPKLATGQITVMAPKNEPKKTDGGVEEAAAAEPQKDEAYWRQRALDIRTRWRQVADEVKELEKNTAEWRRRFYAEDDPYVRDGQIKPEWDRTLDRLGQARIEAEASQKELAEFLEEGRRAGALPGWLRAGKDKEPRVEPPAPPPTEAIEPPIFEPPTFNREDGA